MAPLNRGWVVKVSLLYLAPIITHTPIRNTGTMVIRSVPDISPTQKRPLRDETERVFGYKHHNQLDTGLSMKCFIFPCH